MPHAMRVMPLLLLVVALVCGHAHGAAWLWNVGGKGAAVNITAVVPQIATGRVHLFTTYFGAMPDLVANGDGYEWCNGGIPQLANRTYHTAKIQHDIAAAGLNSSFDGVVVVDYEAWVAIWNNTSPTYHNASIRLVLSQQPHLSLEEATRVAVQQYNAAALKFMTHTLQTVQDALPKSRVGFYGYPTWGYYVNATIQRNLNSQLAALWKASTALLPSIYLPYKSNVDKPYADNLQYVASKLAEAGRLGGMYSRPVLPYTWYRYHNGEPHGLELLDDLDTDLEFFVPFNTSGVEALVIWGDERTDANATAATDYFKSHAAEFARPPAGPALALQTERSQDAALRLSQAIDTPMNLPINGPIPAYKPCSL